MSTRPAAQASTENDPSGGSQQTVAELPEAVVGALRLLRAYVSEVGFTAAHKYHVAPQRYSISPSDIHQGSRITTRGLSYLVSGAPTHLDLASCLLADHPVALTSLTGFPRTVADALVAAELLRVEDGQLRMSGHQLVSVGGRPLLVDASMHFLRSAPHKVYIGVDSLLLSHQLDEGVLGRGGDGIDLGTGSGVIAMRLARFLPRVVATDVSDAALRMVAMNRVLNGREERKAVELRRESYAQTLDRGERYSVVTANPPFLPFPDGLKGPLFAVGPGPDGLGYVRLLIERSDDILTDDGVMYIVSDLVGDEVEPYFAAELSRYAAERRLAIDTWLGWRIDHRVDLTLLRGTANHVARLEGTPDAEEVFQQLRRHVLETLRAPCSHLGVMAVRRAGRARAGHRLFNRHRWMGLRLTEARRSRDSRPPAA